MRFIAISSRILFSLASIVLISLSPSAFATDPCITYANWMPQPDWYDDACNRGLFGSTISRPGGSFSSSGDIVTLNPASLPTVSLPIGVEVSYSTVASKPSPTPFATYSLTPGGPILSTASTAPTVESGPNKMVNFNLIKGFTGIGLGIVTREESTIYANSSRTEILNRLMSSGYTAPTQAKMFTSELTLASAFSIERILGSRDAILPQFGLLMKHSNFLNGWSPGAGTSYSLGPINLGVSISLDKMNGAIPASSVITSTVGFRLGDFQIEFERVMNRNDLYTTDASVLAAALSVDDFVITTALRTFVDYQTSPSSTLHLGVQYSLYSNLGLSYLYNYVPGYHTLAMRVMFF